MVLDSFTSNLDLMSAIKTSVLKKSVDTNELLMNKLIQTMEDNSKTLSREIFSSNTLDIYA